MAKPKTPPNSCSPQAVKMSTSIGPITVPAYQGPSARLCFRCHGMGCQLIDQGGMRLPIKCEVCNGEGFVLEARIQDKRDIGE